MKQNGYRVTCESLHFGESDKFDKFRKAMGADKVDTFLAKFGLGPKYIPKESPKRECPQCHKMNAFVKEEHPDTDMNCMILKCPDCGYEKEL